MNSEHRRRIDLYCDIIVPKLNIMKLWPKLLENGIFNIDDINISTWKRNFDKEETVKSIWLTIKTRGPFAFQNLLLSLQQSDHEELAEMLDKRSDENTEINDNYFSRIKDTAEPLQIKNEK